MKFFPLLMLITTILVSVVNAAAGDECASMTLTPEDHAYHIYPIHHGQCPDGADIRCHKYHWHWVCDRAGRLYWDRRLESAAHAACGCPPPEGAAPATPAVSGKPFEDLIESDGKHPVDLDRLREDRAREKKQ